MVAHEDPAELLLRLKLGREEFCQRLLTGLILDAPYPKWNTRNPPGEQGRRFLRRLDEISFGSAGPDPAEVFVDELELPKRHDDEKGGAPDWAVVWPGRLWLIELKTEKGSHRPGQIESYFDLGRHHFPNRPVDITYLTPPMSVTIEAPDSDMRFAHVTWAQVGELAREVWGDSDDLSARRVLDGLLDTLARLDEKPVAWRARWVPTPGAREPEPVVALEPAPVEPIPSEDAAGAEEAEEHVHVDLLDAAMELVGATAEDHVQRALDVRFADLESLLAVRLAVRQAILDRPPDAPERHVVPWLWRPESTGAPLTDAGADTGYELRFSRYRTPAG